MQKILEGIRVLEVASFLAGPSAAMILGELGADVIKIEQPQVGDPYRGLRSGLVPKPGLPGGRSWNYDSANRSKRGITLNLRTDLGLRVLADLVAGSDVFITNFSIPQSLKMRVDYESLRQHNQRLVYARLSGWGSNGPQREKRAFDYLVQGPSGLMWNVGNAGDPEPSRIVGQCVDTLSGTLLAMAILGALLARERLGVGQEVETSLLGSALHLQRQNINSLFFSGTAHTRNSRAESTNPLVAYYQCADGRWINFCEVQFDEYWPKVASIVGIDPSFARGKEAPAIVAELDKAFLKRSSSEWLIAFDEEGGQLAYAPVLTLEEAVADPQARANRYVVDFDHPTLGRTQTAGFPIHFGATPFEIQSCPPEFGQHTEEVLMEVCRYDWTRLTELKDQGVID